MTPEGPPGLDVDSRAIREVGPLRLPPSVARGTWPCTRCGRDHPVPGSSVVHFESCGRRLQFVVCPDCAERYRVPFPVTLDLRRLPPPERADQHLEPVTAHARFVTDVRGRAPRQVLQLRDADVRQLALRNRETPTTLVRRLAERGMLASA